MTVRRRAWADDGRLCAHIEAVFARCFEARYGVRLVARDDEPLYEPCSGGLARLGYVRDHPRSALHEVAHWCIAGRERRARMDFGYWYRPGPRSMLEQRRFEAVEAWPQALERLFCEAIDLPFEVSIDDLESSAAHEAKRFDEAVQRQAREALRLAQPARAMVYRSALERSFATRCAS